MTFFVRRVFFAEPFFKAHCAKYGTGFHTGSFLHWIQGRGHIIVGDRVTIDGKCGFKFAARYTDKPTLIIGNGTGISHNCSFTVGKKISIGNNCRIASNVEIFDAPGHATDPELRLAGEPASDDNVKPVYVGNNVWIGRRCTIFPGVSIGDNAIIATASAVFSDVPPNSIVAGNPARVIGSVAGNSGPNGEMRTYHDATPDTLTHTVEDTCVLSAKAATFQEVTGLVQQIGRISQLDCDQDFYNEGLSSIASVTLMLELESQYGITIPDESFLACRTVRQVCSLIASLQSQDASAEMNMNVQETTAIVGSRS
jgi:acetyltransferase-like isoleucine patch superfamily enzyme/acyl carrier protein